MKRKGKIKQKAAVYGVILLLCTGVLTGCQETPDEVLVTPKGQNGNVYKEESSAEGTVGERLGIPKTYSLDFYSVDGKTHFAADNLEVKYPNVNKIPIYEVSLMDFDQDFVDTVTEALFGDAPIYFQTDYDTHTRSEIMEEIEFMKESIAKGDMNPYNEGKAGSFDIYEYIDELESEYADAPKEYTCKAVTPSMDFNPEEYGFEIPDEWKEYSYLNAFSGYAVVDDDHVYTYKLTVNSYGSKSRSVEAVRCRRNGLRSEQAHWSECRLELLLDPEDEWRNYYLDYYGVDEEKLEEEAGITLEEAEKTADALVSKLGIEGMERSCWYPAIYTPDILAKVELYDVGYEFHYTRNIDGVSTAYTYLNNSGISEDSTVYSCEYEEIIVIVSEEGIESVKIVNPYEIGNVRQENPSLLSYEEIEKKFEDMLLVQYAGMSDEEDHTEYYVDVDDVSLSYMRITEAETGTYLLAPVWDFTGRWWDTSYSSSYMGADGNVVNGCGSIAYPYPLLTINAMDGTIVDRYLGY